MEEFTSGKKEQAEKDLVKKDLLKLVKKDDG
jgi:hypothetical protein